MNRADLQEMENEVMKLVVQRRALGGFDTNASAIMVISENLLKVIRHLEEKEPRGKKNETKS